MIIKKHSNRNDYLLANDTWVRDFTKESVPFIDLNKNLIPSDDFQLVYKNEFKNNKEKYPNFDTENFYYKNILIVSDGFDFKNKHKVLSSLPSDVKVLAVNNALKYWELVGDNCPEEEKKAILFYIVNNPYEECNNFFPLKNRYWPRCIASTRTNHSFLKNYKNNKYIYSPINTSSYSGPNVSYNHKIDDYRNPICAAISIAYYFGVENLFLFGCDNCFTENRPYSEETINGFRSYPQQIKSYNLIDANLYWMKNKKINIGYHSSGIKFENASYINLEDINTFFKERKDDIG